MLITIPTATDAPIYHWPIATVSIVALNVFCFCLQSCFPVATQTFYLHHGSFDPLTWITSCFMHAHVPHLVGNMIYLLMVGLIVEGKTGWLKFAAIYLVVAFASGMIEQVLCLSFVGSRSLGASGVIYGLIAIAMLWAPENEVNVLCAGIFFYRPFCHTISLSILGVGFFMIGLEFLVVWFSMFAMSSALLHLLGAIPGFAVGYIMLTRQWVDCEGGDLLTQNFGYRPKLTESKKKQLRLEEESIRQARKKEISDIRRQIAGHITAARYDLAIHRLETLRRKHHGKANFSPTQMLAIVKTFDADPARQNQSVFLLDRLLKEQPDVSPLLILAKARQHLLLKDSPRKTLKLIKDLQLENDSHEQLRQSLIHAAKRRIAKGSLELAG